MYWAALSTDIKKSSVNWSGLPNWMQNAVQYHNRIIETVVKVSNDKHNNFGLFYFLSMPKFEVLCNKLF